MKESALIFSALETLSSKVHCRLRVNNYFSKLHLLNLLFILIIISIQSANAVIPHNTRLGVSLVSLAQMAEQSCLYVSLLAEKRCCHLVNGNTTVIQLVSLHRDSSDINYFLKSLLRIFNEIICFQKTVENPM